MSTMKPLTVISRNGHQTKLYGFVVFCILPDTVFPQKEFIMACFFLVKYVFFYFWTVDVYIDTFAKFKGL